MAFSASKSKSKRPNLASSSSLKDHHLKKLGKKPTIRRSRSVDVSEFSNKRDNPLYCCSSSPSPEFEIPAAAFNGISRIGRSPSRSSGSRGRSFGPPRLSARSLSRVEYHGSSESEVEHEYKIYSSLRNKEIGMLELDSQKKKSDDSEETRSLRTWTSQHPISESWDAFSSCSKVRNLENGTSSFSDSEETITRMVSLSDHPMSDGGAVRIYETVRSEVQRAVCEIRNDIENAIRRKNPATMITGEILDIPPDVNPPIDLVSDNRKEYTTMLEQSQERARKLRADLAVEEQRGQELSRMLKEIMVHDPKSYATHRSQPKRKTSIERLKMSMCLAEEARNYFDECVSISTFDSSDFSSPDDLQTGSSVCIPPMGSSRFFPCEDLPFSASRIISDHHYHEESDYQTPCSLSIAGSDFAISSCSGSKIVDQICNHDDLSDVDTVQSGNLRFSFARESEETVGSNSIKHYINNFGRDLKKGGDHMNQTSTFDSEDYNLRQSAESLLFDKVVYRSRIESGGMILCDIRPF